jgi:hypothetical protein
MSDAISQENEAVKSLKNRPRMVVVFDDGNDYAEAEQYAKSKGLDIKSFAKFAMKSYMDKYPRTSGRGR